MRTRKVFTITVFSGSYLLVQIHLGKEDLVLETWRNLLGFFLFCFAFQWGVLCAPLIYISFFCSSFLCLTPNFISFFLFPLHGFSSTGASWFPGFIRHKHAHGRYYCMGFGFTLLESGSIGMGWMLHRIAAGGRIGGFAKELSAFDSHFSFYLSFPLFSWVNGTRWTVRVVVFTTTYCCCLLLGVEWRLLALFTLLFFFLLGLRP